MGLDICVYRPQPLNGIDPEDFQENYGSIFVLEENPELEIFASMAFDKENEYYDLEAAAKALGYELDQLKTCYWSHDKDGLTVKCENQNDEEVMIINPPTVKKIERCIACGEVGYQRKGANSQFYEDEIWSSSCVISQSILFEHWNKYFSEKTPESKGGFGFGVEYDLEDDEMRKRFKTNIIDKFVENETFVIYC